LDQELSITGMSRDAGIWLVEASAPHNPGTYWAFERSTRKISRIVDVADSLRGKTLAQTQTLNYTGRDGTPLWAYVTGMRKPGDPPSPVIIMPHGGPEARDYYEFDPLVQMFASRGYLVVQPNFRGSEGFGRAFMRAGQGQWGRVMQDDVIDALNAVVANGQADATRACIVGWSYGGYAALMGATRDPSLFKCVVSIAGVSDLIEMLREERNQYTAQRSAGYLYWKVSIGELGRDDAALRATSPITLVDKVEAPILLVHGLSDSIVPPDQSKRMADALKRANKPHEILLLEGQGHGISEYSKRLEAFRRVFTFVERAIGAP
jgi:dipeptidyl aminopeptidase/acylaminoacyl peptidase